MDQEDMNHMLLEYSHMHFATSPGTPFTVDLLNCLLQYNGLMPLSNQILQGHTDLTALQVDNATRALLSNMRNKMKPYAN